MNQVYPQGPGPNGPWQAQGAMGAAYPAAVDFDAIQERAKAFIWKTFAWMSLGLGVTGVVAMLAAAVSIRTTPYGELYLTPLGQIIMSPLVYWGTAIVTLIMVLALSGLIHRLNPVVAGALFFVYAALNGVWLSAIFLVYTATSIASTFFVTAGMFGATATYGYLTKRDLSGVGSFMFMGLIGLILASVVNIFVASTALYWLISYAGVIIFVGLTAWDMQKLRQLGGMDMDAASASRASISGAMVLYLDFLNLFLFLLRFLGNRR